MPVHTIDVVLPPFIDSTFDTPDKAIASIDVVNRKRISNEVSSRFGSVIRSAIWTDTAVDLYLDRGRTLSFRCVQNYVHIVLDDPPADTFSDLPKRALLRLAGQKWDWERAGLITALVGRTLHLIQATESTYFLYVSGLKSLWLSVLIDGKTARPFLYWSLTD
jgi:hypothetical protein